MRVPHSKHCPCPVHDPQTKQRQLLAALILVGSFAGIESAIGVSSHSLSLVAEAGHLVSDCFALLLALFATRIAQAPMQWGWIGENTVSIKPHRSPETWAALLNGLGLVAVALWIMWEAIARFQTVAPEISSMPMLITAIVGLLVNSINIAILHQGSEFDLNLRAAFLHVVADAMGAIGVIFAAIAVAVLHWTWADGAISLVISGLILVSTVPLIRQSVQELRRSL
ncbi:MAG TPA: cation diffusion facilitator family transporter [Leptolyngbya sp.]|jgi:cobalt-zinc-cadmium efflux system protein|nr:cation diffusion facilitator family transporter [Leptolyngbya sp.]